MSGIKKITLASIKSFKRKVLSWSKNNVTDFPWRKGNKPFHLLLVEVLLQRTRAENVIPVFKRLKKQYPTARSLSHADQEDIEELIYPLGLRWRAANIVRLGKTLQSKYKGIPPENIKDLIKLPGVGLYAAGAYLSLHSGIRAIIPDANMVRILGRIFDFSFHAETRRDKDFLELCNRVTPARKFREFNYAIIDIGRDICRPKNPKHTKCPLRSICVFYQKEQIDEPV